MLFLDLLKGFAELVGTTGWLTAAEDAVEYGNQFLKGSPFAEFADSKGISRATAEEGYGFDEVPIVDDGDFSRAGAVGRKFVNLFHGLVFVAAALAFFAFAVVIGDFEDLTVDLTTGIGGIGFVGIDMHRKAELGGDADDYVTEDGFAFLGQNADVDHLAILDAEVLGILGGHVDMALGDDNAFAELEGTAVLGIDDSAARATGDIAGKTDASRDAKGTGVGRGNLDLVEVTDGS